MNNFEKNLFEAIKELNEIGVEATPQGWRIQIGNKTMGPNDLPPAVKKAFEEVRSYISRDKLLPSIRKEDKAPFDIVFKAGGEAVITGDNGKVLKKYKLKNTIPDNLI